jgi:hypothetical protein
LLRYRTVTGRDRSKTAFGKRRRKSAAPGGRIRKERAMLTKSRYTVATALAVAAIAAPAATAMPTDQPAGQNLPAFPTPGDPRADLRQADMHASTVTTRDARGEHAASLSGLPDGADLRTPDAVEPFERPVVVEVGEPASPGFDWTAAIIGIAGGLALAVLAAAAVSGGRRRHGRPSTV